MPCTKVNPIIIKGTFKANSVFLSTITLSIKGFKKDATAASKPPTGIVSNTPNMVKKIYGFKNGQNFFNPANGDSDPCSMITSSL